MTTSRVILRIIYILGITGSLALILYSFIVLEKKDSFGVATSSLAVVASIISAWIATRVFEDQADLKMPNVIVKLDIYSRSYFPQFILENIGGSTAKKILIIFPENFKTKFEKKSFPEVVAYLNAGEKVVVSLGGHLQAFDQDDKQIYPIHIQYHNLKNKKFDSDFFLDLGKYKKKGVFSSDYEEAVHEMKEFFRKNGDMGQQFLKIVEAINRLTEIKKQEN